MHNVHFEMKMELHRQRKEWMSQATEIQSTTMQISFQYLCTHTHTRYICIRFACSIVAHSIVSVGRSTCDVAYELAPEHKKLLNRIISIECWIVATLHWNKRAGQNRIDHFWSFICKVQVKSQVNLNGFISATNKIPTKLSFQFHFYKMSI